MNPFEHKRLPRIGVLLSVMVSVALLLSLSRAAKAGAATNWQTGAGCRWAELPVPAAGKTGFPTLPPETTANTFTNFLTHQISGGNQNLLNGSGGAVRDGDGDGHRDFYLWRL